MQLCSQWVWQSGRIGKLEAKPLQTFNRYSIHQLNKIQTATLNKYLVQTSEELGQTRHPFMIFDRTIPYHHKQMSSSLSLDSKICFWKRKVFSWDIWKFIFMTKHSGWNIRFRSQVFQLTWEKLVIHFFLSFYFPVWNCHYFLVWNFLFSLNSVCISQNYADKKYHLPLPYEIGTSTSEIRKDTIYQKFQQVRAFTFWSNSDTLAVVLASSMW